MIGRVNYGSNSSYGDCLPSPREFLITLVIFFEQIIIFFNFLLPIHEFQWPNK